MRKGAIHVGRIQTRRRSHILARNSVRLAGIYGCSRSKAWRGLPCGERCLKWRSNPGNGIGRDDRRTVTTAPQSNHLKAVHGQELPDVGMLRLIQVAHRAEIDGVSFIQKDHMIRYLAHQIQIVGHHYGSEPKLILEP